MLVRTDAIPHVGACRCVEPEPSPSCGEDERALAEHLRRRLLATTTDELAALVARARANRNLVQFTDADEARQTMKRVLADGQPFWRASSHSLTWRSSGPGCKHLLQIHRCPAPHKMAMAPIKRSAERVRLLKTVLHAWANPEMVCAYGITADFSDVLSGCSKGNAVPYSLGAGAGSKGCSVYHRSSTYMGKKSVDIAASATVLIDALKHVKQHPSIAEDSGTVAREAMHFAQRAINHSAMELEMLSCCAGGGVRA